MADTTQNPSLWTRVRLPSAAWLVTGALFLLVAILDWGKFVPVVQFAANAFLGTAPFIAFAVIAVAYMKASGAENMIAKAFEGNETRMIIFAAMLGGMSPFCSCEVIPFVAALLAAGAPLSAVMAFWLASPLMDPAMFTMTAGELGWDFAIAKLIAAIGVGMLGGFGVKLLKSSPVFANPLREKPQVGGCCGVKKPFQGQPVWKFWTEGDRREVFRDTALENAVFLVKWLLLAYTIESLMVNYETTGWVAQFLGGGGLGTILLAALIGMPAYLNGYAAVGVLGGLMEHGMAPGAAMSFMIAGGVSSIPAAVAVWALVKPRVFVAYLGFALTGAILAGMTWQFVA